jgi:hypothetical protein
MSTGMYGNKAPSPVSPAEMVRWETLTSEDFADKGKKALGRERTDIPFEAWVTFVFDHPVPDADITTWGRKSGAVISQPWYVEHDRDWWDPSRQPSVTIAYLTNVFENAPHALASFSDAQIKEGLWFLVSPACSDHLLTLLNPGVAWSERKRCIDSIFTLFEHFLALRCSPHLSHLDEPGANPLNAVCYMWWDLLPVAGKPVDPTRKEIDEAFLDVMRRSLELACDACQESALHGLGHWHQEYPTYVEAIIARFLERHPALRSELKAYALAAQKGLVL